jgi:hypothetical protein
MSIAAESRKEELKDTHDQSPTPMNHFLAALTQNLAPRSIPVSNGPEAKDSSLCFRRAIS